MAGHGSKIAAKQHALIAAMLTEGSLAKAAAKTGVSESTIYRWLRDPSFAEAVREARSRVVDAAMAHRESVMTVAVDALRAIVDDSDIPPTVRISSAKTMLDSVFRARQVEIGSHLAELEEAVDYWRTEDGQVCSEED